jgi:hypothetical protein
LDEIKENRKLTGNSLIDMDDKEIPFPLLDFD